MYGISYSGWKGSFVSIYQKEGNLVKPRYMIFFNDIDSKNRVYTIIDMSGILPKVIHSDVTDNSVALIKAIHMLLDNAKEEKIDYEHVLEAISQIVNIEVDKE